MNDLVQTLGLQPHPEGGFYRETFRSPVTVETPRGPRPASTAIYFLLPVGTFSAWHVVASDEAWHLYQGALRLHLLDEEGHRVVDLTPDAPQAVVPAGVWQPAEPRGEGALCGCTVAPGFDFADFRMAAAGELAAAFPSAAAIAGRLTR